MKFTIYVMKSDRDYRRSLMFVKNERVYYYSSSNGTQKNFRSVSALSSTYYKELKVLRRL